MKTYDVYNSKVHVLELDSIPETGDEMFSVGTYPIIVWNTEIHMDPNTISSAEAHTPGSRGAIGVIGTKTVLVDVECNKESRGLTIPELAQFMLHIVGCKTASVLSFEPILAHTAFLEEEVKEQELKAAKAASKVKRKKDDSHE